MNRFLLVLILVFSAQAIAFAQDIPDTASQGGYLVLPGDKLQGRVLGENDFDFNVVIDESGSFRLPFVDTSITAKCRTENQINEAVKKEYSRFLRDPMVSVTVTERSRPAPVTVSGEVQKPDQVEMRRQARLLELIAFSGGFTADAGGTVQVFRTQLHPCADQETRDEWALETQNGTEVPSKMFSISSIKQGRNESNPIIYPGDIIIVDKASPVYFTGEVVQQTGVYIREGGLSLTQAIAMVGGVREKAKTKDVKIYRLRGENQRDRDTISVNLDQIKTGKQADVMLEPYDIIEVDKAKDSIASTILKIVAGAGRTGITSFATGGARILY
ncbi:MAG: SLBB domain-containing protein [Pyrinomonadaceae bacterium]